MSLQTFLHPDWKDLKYEDKVIFINLKEGLITFHPPMDIKNLDVFLNLYQFKTKKEEFIKLIGNYANKSEEKSLSNISHKDDINMVSNDIEMNFDKNCTSDDNFTSESFKLKENYDLLPITDSEKLKMIKGFWEGNKNDLQLVFRKVCREKYDTYPNYEYSVLGSNKMPLYRCIIKIRGDNQLVFGESNFSKNKARDEAVRVGLRRLVPDLFKQMEMKSLRGPLAFSNLNIEASLTSSLFTNDDVKFDDVIDLNSFSVDKNSELSQSRVNESDNNSNNIKMEFLSRKRQKDENFKSEPSAKKAMTKSLNNLGDDYVFGGCLKEDVYTNLDIDDPLIVDKYLTCSNYSPHSVLNTFKVNNPNIDIVEKVYVRNDGIKFEKLKNDNYIKIVIESQILKIKAECSYDNKKLAREYCAQKFLKKLYNNKFTKWAELVKYFEEKRYLKDKFHKIK